MATKSLATWALALQFSNLTASVIEIAVNSVSNWAGCAIAGYEQPASVHAMDAMLPFVVPQGNSTILGTDLSVDAQTAAFINGIASHADDYDDTHRDNPIHPSGPVMSALLAVAEWKGSVNGEEFLAAFVAGVEAECKIGVAVFPEHYNVGWHSLLTFSLDITSTVGTVGAAVAVGKILGLDVAQLQQAISIASAQVIGMHESFGTETKPFHVGRAAQAGLMSAVLAKAGLTGSLEGLEAERGWSHVVSTRENLTAEIDTLGSVWEISLNTFKPFPCDRIMHAAIDGWIQIHDQAVQKQLDVTKITNVTARCHPRVLFLTDDPEPTTGLAGKFSVYHAAAVSLLFGQATPTQFTDEAVQNSTVVALREKVKVTSDDAVEEHESFVAVEFEDGTKLEVHVEHALGSYENPLTTEQLKEKFLDQVGRVIGEDRATKSYQSFSNIVNYTDVADLVKEYKD
ncbi:unnamed protein product [Clonostachys rosea f. rosea IK726]|uniref:Uncharacterized protein n=1 Tax=Clonostachys rosea f. rosea IK726 TaxID=1349383 RepID=A0ACA9UPF2_BIOOC|nr:unnamed protein product [Clonostachys rosea f. rosea IK726]